MKKIFENNGYVVCIEKFQIIEFSSLEMGAKSKALHVYFCSVFMYGLYFLYESCIALFMWFYDMSE